MSLHSMLAAQPPKSFLLPSSASHTDNKHTTEELSFFPYPPSMDLHQDRCLARAARTQKQCKNQALPDYPFCHIEQHQSQLQLYSAPSQSRPPAYTPAKSNGQPSGDRATTVRFLGDRRQQHPLTRCVGNATVQSAQDRSKAESRMKHHIDNTIRAELHEAISTVGAHFLQQARKESRRHQSILQRISRSQDEVQQFLQQPEQQGNRASNSSTQALHDISTAVAGLKELQRDQTSTILGQQQEQHQQQLRSLQQRGSVQSDRTQSLIGISTAVAELKDLQRETRHQTSTILGQQQQQLQPLQPGGSAQMQRLVGISTAVAELKKLQAETKHQTSTILGRQQDQQDQQQQQLQLLQQGDSAQSDRTQTLVGISTAIAELKHLQRETRNQTSTMLGQQQEQLRLLQPGGSAPMQRLVGISAAVAELKDLQNETKHQASTVLGQQQQQLQLLQPLVGISTAVAELKDLQSEIRHQTSTILGRQQEQQEQLQQLQPGSSAQIQTPDISTAVAELKDVQKEVKDQLAPTLEALRLSPPMEELKRLREDVKSAIAVRGRRKSEDESIRELLTSQQYRDDQTTFMSEIRSVCAGMNERLQVIYQTAKNPSKEVEYGEGTRNVMDYLLGKLEEKKKPIGEVEE